MTARIVVSCDGYFDEGRMPCRGALPTRTLTPTEAREYAATHGWSTTPDGGDLCPSHTGGAR